MTNFSELKKDLQTLRKEELGDGEDMELAVVVVDDVTINRDLVCNAVGRVFSAAECVTARDIWEAIDEVDDKVDDDLGTLLLNAVNPEVATSVARRELGNIPVVLFSDGEGENGESIRDLREKGIGTSLLQRPFNVESIAASVHAAVKERLAFLKTEAEVRREFFCDALNAIEVIAQRWGELFDKVDLSKYGADVQEDALEMKAIIPELLAAVEGLRPVPEEVDERYVNDRFFDRISNKGTPIKLLLSSFEGEFDEADMRLLRPMSAEVALLHFLLQDVGLAYNGNISWAELAEKEDVQTFIALATA